jgi:hypothetical protein
MEETLRKENRGEAFEHYRSLLFSIAYRMTGSASDAEDLVQEIYALVNPEKLTYLQKQLSNSTGMTTTVK